MKHAIIFSSKYGSAEKCAKLIKQKLEGTTQLINLKTDTIKDIQEYDSIIIGGAIYAGKIQKNLKKFVSNYENELSKKKLGIFLLCKEEGKEIEEYFNNNFLEGILKHASVKKHLGHEINLEKMNFLIKIMFKKFFKIKESYSMLNQDAIDQLADIMNTK